MTIKKQSIYKPNLFLISLILFVLLFIPVISTASPIYTINPDESISATENISLDATTVTGISIGSGTSLYYGMWNSYGDCINLTVFEVQGSQGLSEIRNRYISIRFEDVSDQNDGSNLKNYVIPVEMWNTLKTVQYGSGTLYLYSIGNVSPAGDILPKNYGRFEAYLDINSWTPPTGITGTFSVRLYNTTPQKRMSISRNLAVNNFKAPGISHAMISQNQADGEFSIADNFVASLANSKNHYQWKNTINGLKLPSNLTSIQVLRSGFPSGFTGVSNVTINNSFNYPLVVNSVGTNEVYVETYYPPLNITIRETVIGLIYNETWFPRVLPSIPEPIVNSTYSISVTPSQISSDNSQYFTGEITANPSSGLLNISAVLWKWKKFDDEGNIIPSSEASYLDTTDSTTWQAFVKKSDVFYAYNSITKDYTVNKGAALPNPVSLNPIGALGAIQTSAFIILDDGYGFALETTNIIGDNETDTNQIHVRVQDSYTGAFLANTDINIKNLRTGNWSNVTTLSGMYDFTFKNGEIIDIFVDADGYLPYSLQGHYVKVDETIYVNVYRINVGVENQTETYIKIFKGEDSISGYTAPLPYTFYTIENSSNSTEFYHGRTNELGMDRVYLFPSTNYILNVDGGSNYLSVSKNFNTGSISPYEVSIYLYVKSAITTSPTAIPITYGTTAIPIVTHALPNAGINLTCNSDINAEVNIIGLFENAAACNGVTSKENADIIIAAFIIIVCAGILGKIASAMGALIGAGVGFVISIMLQLIPFWILIAVVIIAVVIIAALITKKE